MRYERLFQDHNFRGILEDIDEAYPDGYIRQIFAALSTGNTKEVDAIGDTLAEFIVREFCDVYDEEALLLDNYSSVIHAMCNAVSELQAVLGALQDKHVKLVGH